jgi:threonyl-tRNA synthetase
VWLAPVQVTVLPVAERHEDYAFDLVYQLRERGVRVDITDAHNDNLGTRIRRAKLEKVPYILVVGDDDLANGTVGVNQRGSERPDRDVPFTEFLPRVLDEIATRLVVTPS